MKEFVKYAVNCKRTTLKKSIASQNGELMQNEQQFVNKFVTQESEVQQEAQLDVNNNLEVGPSRSKLENRVHLPVEFLVESVFLSILDSNGSLLKS